MTLEDNLSHNNNPTQSELGNILLGTSICIASLNVSCFTFYGFYRVFEKYVFTNL